MGGKRLIAVGAVVAAAAVAVGVSGAGAAQQQPFCGQTLLKTTKLKADLDCSSFKTALFVGRSGITINLNGHTIWGDGGVAIDSNGYSGLAVQKGAIRGFEVGVELDGGAGHRIYKVVFTDTSFGVAGEDVTSSSVDSVVFNGIPDEAAPHPAAPAAGPASMSARAPHSNVPVGNDLDLCSWSDSYIGSPTGIWLSFGHGNSITNNTVTGAYVGVQICAEASDLVQNNAVQLSVYGYLDSYAGYVQYIDDVPSLPATMYKTNRASYITSMGFAIWPDGYGIVNIVGNLADHADDFGIFPYYDYDARMPVAHAKISKNRASANVDYGFYDENSYGAEWTGNEAEATTDGAGFYFYEPLHESIVNNQSNGNATDGFQIDGTSGYEPAAFKKNTATSNGGWGFWAQTFIGGSGNLSVNNGSSCSNVSCSVS